MLFDLIRTAWAAAPTTAPSNPLAGKLETLGAVLGTLMQVVFWVGIAFSVIFLIVGGIRYITSGGDKAGVEAARGAITNAVIGFVVVIGAFAIRVLVANIIGATLPTEVLPSF